MTDKTISLTVNGEPVELAVEARTSLADVLRGDLRLTGTHLGCEQGACGACTVLIDGVPARSCINSVAAFNGADIRTIEGMDDDPVMEELRQAFRQHHGLQCGFCTPGMLIMARDLVLRMPQATKGEIRLVMSGNLCRCTGYQGIVNAIHSVMQMHGGGSADAPQAPGTGPVGASHLSGKGDRTALAAAKREVPEALTEADDNASVEERSARRTEVELQLVPSVHHSFTLDFPRDQVAERFRDVPFMIACIPGARLKKAHDSGVFEVTLKASMGPISAEFAGLAEPEWNEDTTEGTIYGRGRDKRSATSARGEMAYELTATAAGATLVDVHIGYALSGALGQFARGAIVKQFVAVIVDQFAANFGRNMRDDGTGNTPPNSSELRMGRNIFKILKIMLTRHLGWGKD
ncbi:2Fe-2S iron-sulfur cluster-binding protein [Defluviimonas sp. SAOS-178_SWC]|uniref:2Fe-2S iron-sulfur cluster-binding protein n=1 Tax=Defluviimonas sp. SAOS-178_SWC TaxID=3121287 RepID=UPI003221D49E